LAQLILPKLLRKRNYILSSGITSLWLRTARTTVQPQPGVSTSGF
jgi:hypothetical protein